MNAQVTSAKGEGAPIKIDDNKTFNTANNALFAHNKKTADISAVNFLAQYRDSIAALPENKINSDFSQLSEEEREMLFTLLPGTAALKRRNPSWKLSRLISESKKWHIAAIDKVL